MPLNSFRSAFPDRLAGAAIIGLAFFATPTSAVLIDDFSTRQWLEPNTGGTLSSIVTDPEDHILGGQRQLVSVVHANPEGSSLGAYINAWGGNRFVHNQGSGVEGYSQLVWEGWGDGAGLDFTGGGDATGLEMAVEDANPGLTIEFLFNQSGGGASASQSVTLAGGPATAYVDFSTFKASGEADGPLDVITEAQSLIMTTNSGEVAGLNATIGSIRTAASQEVTIPSPGSLALLGAGLLAWGIGRWRQVGM